MTGRINEQWYCIGSTEFVSTQLPGALSPEWSARNSVHSVCLLADSNGVIARFELSDALRQDAAQTIAALKRRGFSISLLSGDHQNAVAEKLGIADFQSGLSPDGKKEAVKERIARGQGVTVVGDGFNDAPVLASATVSLAMGQGAGLSKRHADVVLLNDRLLDMIEVFDASRRTRRIIKQNMAWAIGYNLLALPAAVSGLVRPPLAGRNRHVVEFGGGQRQCGPVVKRERERPPGGKKPGSLRSGSGLVEILYLLVPLSFILVTVLVGVVVWAVHSGQFDDLTGPRHRILEEEDE